MTSNKILTPEDALGKAMKYCAYQERCHEEVRSKLLKLGMRGAELENIMSRLIQLDFLNEERFAKTYAGSKFRQMGWGKKRIVLELKKRKISEYCINQALKEIPDAGYTKTLKALAEKKWKTTVGLHPAKRKNKVVSYLVGRGYDAEECWQLVNDL